MVIFEELPETAESEQKPASSRPGEENTKKVSELEQELMRVRQDYRSAMEELQSTNEELESSREELQSLNEELNTVNSELNSKMMELKDAYNAVNAVLNSTHIAIVFLDNELHVRRFTPEANQLLNLLDADVGRPIEHISHNLEYEDLLEKIRHVLKNLSSIDEEVRTKEGKWYRMRIMVYRLEGHAIEGVVLTFINIDAQKEAQKNLKDRIQADAAERPHASRRG
jgi:two-component system CheB/CheR fusion protein